MSTFDIKKSCEFDGIIFPVMECALSGTLRRHTHIFPYSPGGATELMARDNYKIKIKSVFCDSFQAYGENLYPTALNEIRRRYESQKIASLNVPNLGVIKAYIYSIVQTMSSKIQNGEDVELVFEEDTTDLFSVETILTQKASSFSANLDQYKVEVDAIKKGGIFSQIESVLDKISEIADTMQSVFDTVQLFDSIVAAKIDSLTDIIEGAADDIDLVKDPTNLTLIEAFKNLWKSAIDLKDTVAGTGSLKPYSVPKDSTLAEVCIQIYGDTSKAQSLLSLNQIDDPFLIPQETIIVYLD